MISKIEITNTLPLSCVENYFLAWLNKYYDVSNLYRQSYVPIERIFDDFSHGATYENYCSIPRLQDIAEDVGIVSHYYYPTNVVKALEIINKQQTDELCLVRVNTLFFTAFKRSSWREDHYVCIDKNLKWINEYPLAEGQFEKEEFKNVYDGAVCVYKLRDLTVQSTDIGMNTYSSRDIKGIEPPHSLSATEDAIGILRITRKRLKVFYKHNEIISTILQKETTLLDRIYFDIHMRIIKEKKIKNTLGISLISDMRKKIDEIIIYENELKEAIENVYKRNM